MVELAYQLGFSSQAHFSARFKSFTGYRPLAYRRSHKRAAQFIHVGGFL
ncbi:MULTISPECIES: AraC family transcriptional regulator [unclassified Agarivorans]